MHQFLLFDDNDMVGVVDGGIRISHDGGHTWTEAEHRSQNVDGPPVTEFCNININCFSVSNPDQFGQVLAGGAVQDLGGIAVLDRPTGTSFSPGEFVISAIAPKPIDTSDSSGNPVSRLRAVSTEAIDTGSGGGQTAKSVEIL